MGRFSERDRSRSRSRERDAKRPRHDDHRRDTEDRDYRRSRDYGGSRDRDNDRGHDGRRDDYRSRDYRRDDRERDRERDRDRRSDRSPRRSPSPHHAERTEHAGGNGTSASGPRGDPLSLEELLRRRAAEKEAEARPVFLTKAQRAELALKRRAEEAAAYRAHADAMREGLAAAAGRCAVVQPTSDRDRDRDRDRGRGRGDDRRDDDRDRRRRDDDRRGGGAEDRRLSERELEAIKKAYLGGEREKRKVVKANERMRFNFDWDANEDTTKGANPALADAAQEAALLFGRGFRAGIDRREQRKAAAEIEAVTLRRARAAAGETETGAHRAAAAARIDAADRYDNRRDMRVDVHWSEKPREAMTERDWRIFREDFSISYKGAVAAAALPIRNWDEAGLPDPVRRAIERVGYKTPSPIQMASIPLGLQQRDVIGVAETGSGKTAAFVLPMLSYILKQPPMAGNPEVEAEGPYAVVLAPTRELAQQIEEETRSLAHYTGFRVVSVVGGQPIEEQGFALRQGCEIVVATPGRLKDCVERRYAVLNQCNYVVLDEADRMIDMGFEPQVMGVLDAMPSSNLKPENEDEPLEANRVYRTTYMFSATMPPAVERLARKYLRRPVVVNIGAAGKATDNVSQRVMVLKENEKPAALERALGGAGDRARIIVFANTQKKCEQVSRTVESLGYAAAMLHGGKTQEQREDAIKGFREDRYNVLVATDVAGRGIDVPNVALVINYDMPLTIEAYTHRIGRTGRAGRKGDAVTFLTMGDTDVFFDLKKFLEESKAPVPRELASHEASRKKPGEVKGGFLR